MGEHPADGDSLDGPERAGGPPQLGYVGDSRIVQMQQASVAQLHDGCAGESLGDRRDPVERGRMRQLPGADIGEPDPGRPG